MDDASVPQRIGDAERDRAVALLREHHAAGRLDMVEFDDRMQQALKARTSSDLDPLFVDLPVDPAMKTLAVPDAAPAPVTTAQTPTPEDTQDDGTPIWWGIISALAWPATIIASFATGFHHWWLWMIPIFLLPALGGAVRDGARRRRLDSARQAERQQRRETRNELRGRR